MPDEAKTPGNEGFVEEIHRIITENEEDPWAGNDYADRMQPEKSFPGDRYEYELRDARLQAPRQQREAVEEALEDVGENLGGFVEQIPFGGEFAEDIGKHVWEGAEEMQAHSLTESEEANIEMYPPENDPGMFE